MGKRVRKTRWRTLTISDDNSDSEESIAPNIGRRIKNGYHQSSKPAYYNRFTYNNNSSQSTPIRRYQCDNNSKSTRSSSTASENKITFNEDEYTRITTPRQDVLFKKGYLNKPKTYQTQTSTGTSTTSASNSTGNGTPDHQSTDLEYESQFVFPNGFVDQNGIYYVNGGFESYPFMVYNPPTYYHDVPNVKSKRDSSGSVTGESTSPNNEESSQDLIETSNTNDFNGGHQVYIYPGFYINGACQPQGEEEGEKDEEEIESRKVKKRRRRKSNCSETSSANLTEDEEIVAETEKMAENGATTPQKRLLNGLNGQAESDEDAKKYDLKPDAEEFIPRAYRQEIDPSIPTLDANNVQFIKVPPNFVPVPILNSIGEFNTAFIPPPGLHPINLLPPPNFVNFIPNYEEKKEEIEAIGDKTTETNDKDEIVHKLIEKNQIDIAKIVSKLEEAAKEQVIDTKIDKKSPLIAKPSNIYNKSPKKIPKKDVSIVWPKRESIPVSMPTKNYSETLKSTPSIKSPIKIVKQEKRKVEMVKKPEIVQKSQWISVSNRKKRKNRNVEEDFDNFEKSINKDDDLFESYDINQLKDVKIEQKSEEIAKESIPEVSIVEVVSIPEVALAETVTIPKIATISMQEIAKVSIPEVSVIEKEIIEKVAKTSTKKNNKPIKKVIKAPIKRIIITDIDQSMQVNEPKPEKVETPKPIPEIIAVKKDETPEKKTKKKKKKKSLEIPSSTSIIVDQSIESYDFLIEPKLLDESHDKTNIEMSQELDKMIQRGIYTNLEEKIKSLQIDTRIDARDDFFKTIIDTKAAASRETSVEKAELGLLMAEFKPKAVILEPMRANLNMGDFLGDSANLPATSKTRTVGDNDETKRNLPITKAVKEWMTRTRETTPDIELLKSPSAILREFGADSDDETTVFEVSREGSVEDVGEATKTEVFEAKMAEEDAIEVYESCYGQNGDFLKIKEEIEANAKGKEGFLPKHGNLPYRAICCSIM